MVPTKQQRAEPLAPEDRRRAIVEAVIPLLLEKGAMTTSEIAQAAGIAEGTIFRVFPDKTALLLETIKHSLDPAPAMEQLAAIESELPFEIKLRKAAAIVVQRTEKVHALAGILRSMPPPSHEQFRDTHKNIVESNGLIFWGLTRLFGEEEDKLAVQPARAAAAFRGLLHAVSFPMCDPGELITADEAIDVLLNGVCNKERVTA